MEQIQRVKREECNFQSDVGGWLARAQVAGGI